MKDTRYPNSKKKRFDGLKNSSYLCETKVL